MRIDLYIRSQDRLHEAWYTVRVLRPLPWFSLDNPARLLFPPVAALNVLLAGAALDREDALVFVSRTFRFLQMLACVGHAAVADEFHDALVAVDVLTLFTPAFGFHWFDVSYSTGGDEELFDAHTLPSDPTERGNASWRKTCCLFH